MSFQPEYWMLLKSVISLSSPTKVIQYLNWVMMVTPRPQSTWSGSNWSQIEILVWSQGCECMNTNICWSLYLKDIEFSIIIPRATIIIMAASTKRSGFLAAKQALHLQKSVTHSELAKFDIINCCLDSLQVLNLSEDAALI